MKKEMSLEEKIIFNKNSLLVSALIFTPIIFIIIILGYLCYLYINKSLSSLNFPLLISSVIAFTGLWLTSFSLLTNSIETRRKSSMDILFSLEKDLEFYQRKNFILSTPDLKFDFLLSSAPNDSWHIDLINLRDNFYYCANMYEFLALSIRKGTIDEQIFNALYRSRFLKFWKKTQPVIVKLRKKESKNTLFENIEWLADRCT